MIDCGHTFCKFCIEEWDKKKHECPICRKKMSNISKHCEIEALVNKIFLLLSDDIKKRRQATIEERKSEVIKAANRPKPRENISSFSNDFTNDIRDMLNMINIPWMFPDLERSLSTATIGSPRRSRQNSSK